MCGDQRRSPDGHSNNRHDHLRCGIVLIGSSFDPPQAVSAAATMSMLPSECRYHRWLHECAADTFLE
jgi:hypothetical protein